MCDSNDILQIFSWINSNFIQNLIEKSEQTQNVKVKSYLAKRAFDKGEGFSSYIISLKVEFQKENESKIDERDFLMKIAIQTDEFAETCKECLVYEREIEAYSRVLPAVERCFKNLGMEVQIAPRYFKVQISGTRGGKRMKKSFFRISS